MCNPATGADPTLRVPEPIELRWAFSVSIFFEERVLFATRTGTRGYVPVVRGDVWGPRLTGRVVPHSGADWAANGRINAHYMLQASDNSMIYMRNTGRMFRLDGKTAPPDDPTWEPSAPRYFRLTPEFDAPVGPHEWLSRTVFVGRGQRMPDPDRTIFDYFEVL
jgi:Protein of unknown function (DUF3237)